MNGQNVGWVITAGTASRSKVREAQVVGINDEGVMAGSPSLVAGGVKVALPVLGAEDPRQTIVTSISDDGATLAGQVSATPLPVVWTCRRG